MKKRKGVVMGVEGRNVVVYTGEGDFIRLPMPGNAPEIGDVVEVGGKAGKPLTVYFAVAAVLVLVAVIGLFNPLFGSGAAAAYVALDVNPSVELTVNRDGMVTKTRPLNQEAETLLAEVKVNGQDLYGAVNSIIKEAGKLGYINKEHQNLVLASIISLKGGAPAVQEEELRRVINDELVDLKAYGTIVVSKDFKELRAKAEKTGLSINKYMVYDRAQKEGINIPVEALHNNSVRQVLDEANIPLKKIFPSECVEVPQVYQKPADNGDSGPVSGGMRRGLTETPNGSGMGHGGVEHSGPVRGPGGYDTGPTSGGDMPSGHTGQEHPVQTGDSWENRTGEMQMESQDMGGHTSGPAGQVSTGTAGSRESHAGMR